MNLQAVTKPENADQPHHPEWRARYIPRPEDEVAEVRLFILRFTNSERQEAE